MNLKNRVFTIPKEIPAYKITSLILKKLEMSEFIKGLTEDDQRTNNILTFERNPQDRNVKIFAGNSNLNIGLRSKRESLTFDLCCKYSNNVIPENLQNIFYNRDVLNYSTAKSILDSRISVNFNLEVKFERTSLGDIKIKTGIDTIPKKMMFAEECNEDMIRMLVYAQRFDNPSQKTYTLNLNTFAQLQNFIQYDPKQPSNETMNYFFDLLKEMDKRNVKNVRCNALSVSVNRGTIACNLGGFEICEFPDEHLNFYQYVEHPGLTLAASYLESEDLLIKFESRLQKQVVKTM